MAAICWTGEQIKSEQLGPAPHRLQRCRAVPGGLGEGDLAPVVQVQESGQPDHLSYHPGPDLGL